MTQAGSDFHDEDPHREPGRNVPVDSDFNGSSPPTMTLSQPDLFEGLGVVVPTEKLKSRQMNNYLLWSRFAALNLAGMAGLALAYVNGWVGMVIAADASRITVVIAALFLFGLIATGIRVHKVTRELDHISKGSGGRLDSYRKALECGSDANRALELRLFSRIAYIRHIANVLVLLGLIGTVVGFIMALSGVSAEAAADVGRIGPMVANLISGMAVALFTTLVGAIFNLWLGANFQILTTGTANLAAAMLDDCGGADTHLPDEA